MNFLCEMLWVSTKVSFCFRCSNDKSMRILSIWNNDLVHAQYSICIKGGLEQGKCHTSSGPIFIDFFIIFLIGLMYIFTLILIQTFNFCYVYTSVYIFTHILIRKGPYFICNLYMCQYFNSYKRTYFFFQGYFFYLYMCL